MPSFHEIGTRDLPAMIDYVLNYTKQKTLRYIGHSMGTTVLFVLLSMKPKYNTKIKLGILLAPVAIWKKLPTAVQHISYKVPKIKVKRLITLITQINYVLHFVHFNNCVLTLIDIIDIILPLIIHF